MSLRIVPSTVTSPRYPDWQDAAKWAAGRGLLQEHER